MLHPAPAEGLSNESEVSVAASYEVILVNEYCSYPRNLGFLLLLPGGTDLTR